MVVIKILRKCEVEDLRYISEVLDNYFSFTDDNKRKELLAKDGGDNAAREELLHLIDKQIKYFGSSDVAYIARSLTGSNGGVTTDEIIEDVCKKLNVKIKIGGSNEAKLERLVQAVVEKDLLSKKPEELAKAFEKIGIGNADREQILKHIEMNGKVAILPLIYQYVGAKAATGIIETIVISIIAQFIGKEAAKHLVKEVIKRNPWLASLGPALWTVSGAWLAFDLQGPAYRKTIPICLYLGVVALRDGEEPA